MTYRHLRRGIGVVLAAALAISTTWAADSSRSKSPASKGKAGAARSGRAVLPDPALLDGSAYPPEKKSEYGMIGDFELPGDENSREQRVGGSSQPPPGSEQQQQQQGGGGMPPVAGTESAGASDQQIEQQQQQAQGGGQAASQAQGGQQQGGSAGQAGGIQVAQLEGEGGAQGAPDAGNKPPPVAIGDTAMRIPSNSSNPSVVGGQQIAHPNTQHHDKVGSGGKAPTAQQGPNRVERGRAIPAGL